MSYGKFPIKGVYFIYKKPKNPIKRFFPLRGFPFMRFLHWKNWGEIEKN
jgi:hypothetical protein